MAKKLLLTLLVLIFISSGVCFSQNCRDIFPPEVVKEAKKLPLAPINASVNGFPFGKTLYISKDSLNKGFKVNLGDSSYKILFFALSYDCESCDLWEKLLCSEAVTLKDAPILYGLRKNEILHFSNFKVEIRGKYFTLSDFTIITTD